MSAESAGSRWGAQLLDDAYGAAASSSTDTRRCGGRILGVKEANLEVSARDSPRWRLDAIGGHSVLELIRAYKALSRLDACDVFVKAVRNKFFETILWIPLTIDHGMNWRKEIVGAGGKKMWYISLEEMQHFLIVEKSGGIFRVYQSYIRDEYIPGMGYTAGQWCSICGALEGCVAHKGYGGGFSVGNGGMDTFLDWIVEAQKMAKKLIPHLLKHVDGIDAALIPLFGKDPRKLSPAEVERATEALQLIASWSNEVNQKVGPVGITTLDSTQDSEVVVVTQGAKVIFEVPRTLYYRFRTLHENITGQTYLSPVVFVRLINMGIWWEIRTNPNDGGAVGFTIRGADLGVTMSPEE